MSFNHVKTMGALCALGLVGLPVLAAAGVTVYDHGEKSLKIGARLQPQYRLVDTDRGGSGDDLFLRRFRFYLAGTVTEDVSGKWQIDFGKNSDSPEVKDAYINYSGIPVGSVTVGNFFVPFAREQLSSSKRQKFVERTVVGDHNFGVPDRELGAKYSVRNDYVSGDIGVFQAGIDPSLQKIDFESNVDSDSQYFGNMAAARVNFEPLGDFNDYAQGAFGTPLRYAVGVNAYTWFNDNDTDADLAAIDPTVGDFSTISSDGQYDNINGYGVDAALKFGYFSASAAYQYYDADTRNNVTRVGLVDEDGDARFSTFLVKAGYMVVPSKFEFVAGFSGLNPDDDYYFQRGDDLFATDATDKRYSLGANYYLNKHHAKIQVTYELGRDILYADDANGQVAEPANIAEDQNRLFIQFQQVL